MCLGAAPPYAHKRTRTHHVQVFGHERVQPLVFLELGGDHPDAAHVAELGIFGVVAHPARANVQHVGRGVAEALKDVGVVRGDRGHARLVDVVHQPRRVVKVVVGRLVLAFEVGGGIRPGLHFRNKARVRARGQAGATK